MPDLAIARDADEVQVSLAHWHLRIAAPWKKKEHVVDVEPSTPTASARLARRSHWLEGIRGTVRFLVEQAPVAALIVDDGEARVVADDAPADTTVICRSRDDVDGLLRGELNPVIVALLGRLEVEGDVVLGINLLNSLRAEADSTAAR